MYADVTEQLISLGKQLSFLQVVLHPDLPLQDTMHAHQINDPKIDTKHDIHLTHNIQTRITNNQIRQPSTLTIKDHKNIYAQMLRMEVLVLRAYPLAQTIYTLTYLYDQQLYKEDIVVGALVQSINSLGAYIYSIHKEACSVKEDDLSFSTFSFRKTVVSHDQATQMFLKAEKLIQNQLKNNKDAEIALEGKQLLALMKLRRSFHGLVKAMGKIYQPKQQSKIQAQLKSIRKKLGQLQALVQKNGLKQAIPQGVFSKTIAKALRTNYSLRQVPSITTLQAIQQIRNLLDQFDLFLPIPPNASQCKHRLDLLSHMPLNIWSKAYIKYNLFQRQGYLMNTFINQQVLLNDIKEWTNLNNDVLKDQKFDNLIKLSTPAIAQTLYRMLGRNTRWFWECSKAYEDINVMIHLANEIDMRFNEKKRVCSVSSWFYNWATTFMTRQVMWAFEEDLYEPVEYPYAAYYLQYVLHVYQKNIAQFNAKLQPSLLQSYYDGSLGKNKKRKKHLSDTQRKIFAQGIFLKGIHYYFRSFARLCIILKNRGHLVDPHANQQLRFNNRFRIFKNVLFLRKLTWQSYQKEVGVVLQDQLKVIQQATELLKAARNIFSLFSQFEESQTYFGQVKDAVVLQKMAVKLSLVVISVKLKQKKEFQLGKEAGKYPEIKIK